MVISEVVGSLLPTWETWIEFLPPDFELAYPRHGRLFRSQPVIANSLSLPLKLEKKELVFFSLLIFYKLFMWVFRYLYKSFVIVSFIRIPFEDLRFQFLVACIICLTHLITTCISLEIEIMTEIFFSSMKPIFSLFDTKKFIQSSKFF